MFVQGKIKIIGETEEFGSNGFLKRELVLVTEEQYPQHLSIEFVQDKCVVLDNFGTGQSVKISINLRGREWTNPEGEVKHFNSIQGWRIENVNSQQTQSDVDDIPPAPANDFNEEDHDDLPF